MGSFDSIHYSGQKFRKREEKETVQKEKVPLAFKVQISTLSLKKKRGGLEYPHILKIFLGFKHYINFPIPANKQKFRQFNLQTCKPCTSSIN